MWRILCCADGYLSKLLHLGRPICTSGLSQVHLNPADEQRPRCSCRAGEVAQEEREAALEQLAAAREDQKTAEEVVANAAAKLQVGPAITIPSLRPLS